MVGLYTGIFDTAVSAIEARWTGATDCEDRVLSKDGQILLTADPAMPTSCWMTSGYVVTPQALSLSPVSTLCHILNEPRAFKYPWQKAASRYIANTSDTHGLRSRRVCTASTSLNGGICTGCRNSHHRLEHL